MEHYCAPITAVHSNRPVKLTQSLYPCLVTIRGSESESSLVSELALVVAKNTSNHVTEHEVVAVRGVGKLGADLPPRACSTRLFKGPHIISLPYTFSESQKSLQSQHLAQDADTGASANRLAA